QSMTEPPRRRFRMPARSPMLKAAYWLSTVRAVIGALRSSPTTLGVNTLGTRLSAAIGPPGDGASVGPHPAGGNHKKVECSRILTCRCPDQCEALRGTS